MRLWWIMVMASCAGSPRPATISNRGEAPPIVVRMAGNDEFLNAGGRTRIGRPCPITGEPERELYEPLLAFARAQLLDNAADGVDIKIESRSQIGELRISDDWDDGSATAMYCTHVVREAQRIVVVVRQRWSVSSAFSRAAELRGALLTRGVR